MRVEETIRVASGKAMSPEASLEFLERVSAFHYFLGRIHPRETTVGRQNDFCRNLFGAVISYSICLIFMTYSTDVFQGRQKIWLPGIFIEKCGPRLVLWWNIFES